MPFVARWPGVIEPASTCSETICLNDLMATAAEIIGVELPPAAGVDSFSLLPAFPFSDTRGEKGRSARWLLTGEGGRRNARGRGWPPPAASAGDATSNTILA